MSASLPDILPEIDTSSWPSWAASAWPGSLKWAVVLLSVFGIWIAAVLVKRTVKFIGRRVKRADEFEGSPWDLGGSLSQLLALILLSPIPLHYAGYDVSTLITNRGPGAVAAVATLIVAIIFSSWLSHSILNFGDKAHQRTGADDTLFTFVAAILKYTIFAVALVFALTQLGFPTASLAALVGAAGLAIGLALQDTLKAVAAGVMLAIFRPFRIGDWVTLNGLDGEVFDITPFQTAMKQIDNKVVFITNDKVWGEPLINHTRMSRRRLDLYFDISYDDDMRKAIGLLEGLINDHPLVVAKEENWVVVHRLSDWSVQLRLRAWVNTRDFIQVRADINEGVKNAFDANGITIPYPHQVEIQREDAPRGKSGSAVEPETDTSDS